MSWDPEVDDPTGIRPRPAGTPSDVGADRSRDYGDEPPPAWRDKAPDPFAPIDPNAPVSGHVPVSASRSITEAPENDWSAAAGGLYPLLRPPGTTGTSVDSLDTASLVMRSGHHATAPLIDDGPGGTVIVFALPSGGFDVIVNAEHVISWEVSPEKVCEVAVANLASWSKTAPWTDEVEGERRLISSATGDGWDASRILLSEVREHLASELGGSDARVLVGMPDRHLLVAARLTASDPEFASMFESFVRGQAEGADEPIDQRVFELKDGELAPFAG